MTLRWWCSAQGAAWEWTWRPYPGVWVVVALLLLARRSLARGSAAAGGTAALAAGGRGRAARYVLGVFLLWLALDWPVGALGGGYLASAHMLQFHLVALVAPLLLLTGLPAGGFARLRARPRLLALLTALTRPLAALVLFNAALVFTHLPEVVDRLRPTQAGSFAIDALWFGAGLVLWWPIACPVPERPRFPDPAKMGYLFANTLIMGAISLFLVFGEWPLWAVYELAPRVAGIGAQADHQAAGVLMKVGGMLVHWSAITVLFFRWYRREATPAPVAPDRPAAAR